MSNLLAEAASAADIDAAGLAAITGVDADETAAWLASGQVPDEHRPAVHEALDLADEDASVPSDAKATESKSASRSSSSRKKRSSKKNSLTAAEVNAVRVSVTIAFADERQRRVAALLTKVEPSATSSEDAVAEIAEQLLSLPKSTSEALAALVELREVTNPIKVGLRLGQMDRNALRELSRVSRAIAGVDDDDLPAGDEAALTVAMHVGEVAEQHQDVLRWLVQVAG